MPRNFIHENDLLSTVHKFHLLKSYLRDDVSSVIDVLNATEENYFIVWDLV
ncbi:hypothetical protein WH47_09079 [Habropoda laboriosa]|uniref:Uncharacterized protein n=1 Tax=Habropoda laboriosa TaxID=597456 RepID=A0A0L7QJE9_9HYME|nr:hypothetical protein WH47_09079 [Habropoda laboriosa]